MYHLGSRINKNKIQERDVLLSKVLPRDSKNAFRKENKNKIKNEQSEKREIARTKVTEIFIPTISFIQQSKPLKTS